MTGLRIGQGFDVHRYRAGRPLVLCGERIEGEVGLDGHSDADVALHAVADALLGAVGAGDIGLLWPPTDAQWKDADSRVFVLGALDRVRDAGYRPVNVDLTLIGERPRLTPHRERLRTALAGQLELPPDRVNVKATTTEGLGFPGRREGLAALAVVLVEAR